MKILNSSIAGTLESSDIMISLEPGSGAIEIELQSIVEKQFGRQICSIIKSTLSELNIESAKVKAVDKGALDCTIQARVRAAVHLAAGAKSYEWMIQEVSK